MSRVRGGSGKVVETADRTIFRFGRGNARRYVIATATEWTAGRREPILAVTGSALRGTAADFAILNRVSILREDFTGCSRRFEYGWDFLLGPRRDETRR